VGTALDADAGTVCRDHGGMLVVRTRRTTGPLRETQGSLRTLCGSPWKGSVRCRLQARSPWTAPVSPFPRRWSRCRLNACGRHWYERLVPDARAKVLARSSRRFLDGADAITVRNVGRGRLAHFGTFLPATPGLWLGGGTTRVTVDQDRFLLHLTRETGILTMHLTTTVSTKGQAILPNLKPPTTDFAPTRPEDMFGCLPYRGKPKSIEEMDAGIAQEVKRRHARDRH
jgi:hypothetical protein